MIPHPRKVWGDFQKLCSDPNTPDEILYRADANMTRVCADKNGFNGGKVVWHGNPNGLRKRIWAQIDPVYR